MATHLNQDDIKKIEAYFDDENYSSVDYFLASHKRLLHFCKNAYEDLEMLSGSGDLE